ncbi:MAG TPA: dihydrolipoamide acetyltransferase family protein [Solirubrobacteraceae bacterium]|nr:dihydrolipoamide acetyltransferase family protein [Solirubrobacteraceae bacterium]
MSSTGERTDTARQTSDQIVMPRLSDSMEEGTILRWLIAEGQRVSRGQELVEIETDKASMTYEADLEGVLHVLVPEGETVAVGVPIARVGAAAEQDAPVEPDVPEPVAQEPVESEGVGASILGSDSHRIYAESQPVGDGVAHASEPANVLATPLARRAARVHGVALAQLAGSGPRGRVLQSDVLSAAGVSPPGRERILASPPTAEPVSPAESHSLDAGANGTAKGGAHRVEPTRTQRLIARRMAEAKATIPEFQVQTEVVMDAAIGFRAELKGILEGEAPSLNDLIVKACALALRGHPRANGSWIDGGFELHERVNVGVAVAAEEALVVPVVADADRKALGQIARETRALAERVRLGTIAPPELAGGTFTVSNLGMYGMTQIVPVINPPQAAILGVGATRTVLAREGGEIVERQLMTLTLSCDHRILYGADAALFLGEVKGLLEAPLQLAL